MKPWDVADLPDLTGRCAVVTGANSGLGIATSQALAHAGAHVVLGVRDLQRGWAAASTINGSKEVRRLDLADLTSVRDFAQGWSGDLDLLVNNAGVMGVAQGRTMDGFEVHLGTNHLGHFALTNLLLPHLTGRVVTVSSAVHRSGRIDFADINLTNGYRASRAYAQSKLANLLFVLELQRRLLAAGSPVRAHAAHPGWAVTNLQARPASRPTVLALGVGNRLIGQDNHAGALPTLYAATADLPPASYVGPSRLGGLRGPPRPVRRSADASDPDLAQRLWGLSESMTRVTFPLGAARDTPTAEPAP
jgi:NAD(P)-dependent dehydrogenase (short-subunit alcohol dehydrogenase family)